MARVALLRRLQDRRYSLSSIGDLLQRWQDGAGLSELLGLEDAVAPARPRTAGARAGNPAAVLPELFADEASLRRALELELVVRVDGEIVAPIPELVELVRDHLRAGMPLANVLEEGARLRADAERIAQRFREMFQTHLFTRFTRAGSRAEDVAALADAVTRLRAAGVRATALLLEKAMERGGPPGAPAPELAPAAQTRRPKRSRPRR